MHVDDAVVIGRFHETLRCGFLGAGHRRIFGGKGPESVKGREMFLRFTTTRIHEVSHKPEGVFQAALSLLWSEDLHPDDWKRLREILSWFNKNLPQPPDSFSADRALFWFKSSSNESIKRVWDMEHILRAHGYHVVVHKCRRLGNVCYEDEFQVAAYPSLLDGRITSN